MNVALVMMVTAFDWVTPAGVVVGMFLCVPIVLSSLCRDPRHVWGTSALAVLGFVCAAILGREAVSPTNVWVPNRLLALASLPASCVLALVLQRRRSEADRARDHALSASHVSRLVTSLLAHDLRAPLTLASQGLDYLEAATAAGEPADSVMIAEIRARLQRSLQNIESVLALARAELARTERFVPEVREVEPAEEIEAVVRSFDREARIRGKTIVADLQRIARLRCRVDSLVLRQTLAILLDNGVRYTVPGTVRVTADVLGQELHLRVADDGPGLTLHLRERTTSSGAGLGLRMCGALLEVAGGRLDIEADASTGTSLLIRLPASFGRSRKH